MSVVRRVLAEHMSDAPTRSVIDAPAQGRPQPTKRLPTERIRFPKQLDIIRAYGIRSDNGTRPANYKEVAEDVSIHPNTVVLLVRFLVENGFLERIGNEMMPTRPVIEFTQAHNWSPENAPRKLAPLVQRSWFGELLLRKLRFRSLPEEEALAELAGAIAAGPEYKPQIATLVDYAVACGLVRRDGTLLTLGEESLGAAPGAAATAPDKTEEATPVARDDRQTPARSTSSVTTGFMTTEGIVQFHVDVRVTMKEMAGWAPDRISAFFAGLAQVLAAKKGTEEIEP